MPEYHVKNCRRTRFAKHLQATCGIRRVCSATSLSSPGFWDTTGRQIRFGIFSFSMTALNRRSWVLAKDFPTQNKHNAAHAYPRHIRWASIVRKPQSGTRPRLAGKFHLGQLDAESRQPGAILYAAIVSPNTRAFSRGGRASKTSFASSPSFGSICISRPML